MQPLWDVAIEPVVTALRPKRIVEIGSLFGGNTRKILNACAENAVIHAIDPAPKFDVEVLAEEYGDSIVFHQDASLNVLHTLPTFDLALIDGDHNWYTVYHELKAIEGLHKNPVSFPLLFLHDVCWPYGRRDLYYDVSRIPEEHRQPYRKAGIRLWQSELADGRGLNGHFDNAEHEGGPKNGVLTALEDFIAESDIDFHVVHIPAYFGLSVVASTARLANEPDVRAAMEQLLSAQTLYKILERVEAVRCTHMQRQHELEAAVKRLRNAQDKESQ